MMMMMMMKWRRSSFLFKLFLHCDGQVFYANLSLCFYLVMSIFNIRASFIFLWWAEAHVHSILSFLLISTYLITYLFLYSMQRSTVGTWYDWESDSKFYLINKCQIKKQHIVLNTNSVLSPPFISLLWALLSPLNDPNASHSSEGLAF